MKHRTVCMKHEPSQHFRIIAETRLCGGWVSGVWWEGFSRARGCKPVAATRGGCDETICGGVRHDHQENVLTDEVVRETRALAARLIDAGEAEIAFVGSTSIGAGNGGAGLPWERGDNVVCYLDDYPANVYPWMDLGRRGVETRLSRRRRLGNVTVEDVERWWTKKRKLVSLASVHFQTGWRFDVDRIGRFLRERGILFCLDGIRVSGHCGRRWSLSILPRRNGAQVVVRPLGTAIFLRAPRHFDRFHPPLVGWTARQVQISSRRNPWRSKRDARRYEHGSLNLAGIVGLRAALQLILNTGSSWSRLRVLGLAELAIGWDKDRIRGLGATEGKGLSGIVFFAFEGREQLAKLHAKLEAAQVVTSLRYCRDGKQWLRLSPHFYNTEQEIAGLFAQI